MVNFLNLKPELNEFPLETVFSESETREQYLKEEFLPSIKKQEEEGKLEIVIDSLLFKKIGVFGKGRSGAAGKDFVSRMKKWARYNGRKYGGKICPMCQYLDDLSVSVFPPGMSTLYFISGSGTTKDVVTKVLGCLDLDIKIISLSGALRSPLVRCSDMYIYIPMKLAGIKADWRKKDIHPPIDVMGNSFETGAYMTSSGIVEGIIEYHKTEDVSSASKKCLNYIESSVDYVKYLNQFLDSIKPEIKKFGESITTANHIRMAAAGDGAASLKMAMNRIAHTGRTGFGKTIDFISSDDYGPPGYADIEKDDCVILSSGSLKSSHTISIIREATNAGAQIYLLTTEESKIRLPEWFEKYKIREPELVISLPYSIPESKVRFYDLGVRHFLEYITAAVFVYLGMSHEDVEKFHLQSELE